MNRRDFLRDGSLAGLAAALAAAGWIPAARAEEWNRIAFEAKSMEDVLKALGGGAASSTGAVAITAPELAEHGAVVPISAVSRAPDTDALAILVEKNPNTLAALFSFPSGTAPEVSTRIKMAQTSNVYVVARSGGRFVYAVKEVKITLGGCGG